MKYFGQKNVLFNAGLCICLLTFIAAGCGGTSSKKILFSQGDIEGNWIMKDSGYGRPGSLPFSSAGSVAFSASGKVIEGGVTNIGVDYEKFTGGNLVVTEQGGVTGVIDTFLADCDSTEKHSIISGQMTLDKDVIVFAGNFPIANDGIGILLKKRGSFTASALEGTWVFPLEGIFTVSVNNIDGTINDCNFSSEKGEHRTCTGKLSITPQGDVSGFLELKGEILRADLKDVIKHFVKDERSLVLKGEKFRADLSGPMGSGKNRMILSGSISTRFEGAATLALKREGAFSLSDSQGNWKIFRTGFRDTRYGTIGIDSAGRLTGGDWRNLGSRAGTFAEGKLTVSDQGGISGYLTAVEGNSYTILDGQMSSTRDLAVVLDRDDSGHFGMVILVKMPSQ